MSDLTTRSYVSLIRDFLEGRASARQFQVEYMKRMKTDTDPHSQEEFQILERMFEDCDAYWTEGRTASTITEAELREGAQTALRKLKDLVGPS